MGGELLLEEWVSTEPKSVQRQMGQSAARLQKSSRLRESVSPGAHLLLADGEARAQGEGIAFQSLATSLPSLARRDRPSLPYS